MQDKETLISELGTAKKWQELVGFGRKENNAQPFVIELGLSKQITNPKNRRLY
jgi:hypothetical protein